ncbi:elongation factor 1-beta [Thermoplasmatales archaeon SW_10_69_26]|jgi:elongation factor 1-beta|nr:MAG: elongation factor 1-beta [Thermoplasmatales archaeon SW_10_69_26]
MGDLVAVFKVMPASPETDLDAIEDSVRSLVPADVELEQTETEAVAFGLEALMTTVSMPDSDEISADDMEQDFAKIDGVESVECTDVGRL